MRATRQHYQSLKNNTMDKYADFPITSVCRADLESIGFDASAVPDSTLKELAGKLADDYCGQLFWSSLEIIADWLKIPKRASTPVS
jgi:hypothetical protein